MVIGNKIVEFEGHWPVIQKVAVLRNSHVTSRKTYHFR